MYCFLAKINYSNIDINADSYGCLNSEFTDLAKVKDKLYYNYYGNFINSGTYEISKSGAKKIKNAVVKLLPEYDVYLDKFVSFNNKTMTYPDDNILFSVSSESDSNDIINCQRTYEMYDGEIYLINIGEKKTRINKWNKGLTKSGFKLDKHIYNYFINKEKIYYTIKRNNCYELYCSKFDSNKSQYIKKLNYPLINNIFVHGNDVFICSSNQNSVLIDDTIIDSISCETINNNHKTQIIKGKELIAFFNNKNLYFCIKHNDEYELYLYNNKLVKLTSVTKYEIEDFWVFDKKYVYYKVNNVLYRVNVLSKKTEKVFG